MTQQSTRLAADDQPLVAAQTAQKELENGAAATDTVATLKTDLRSDSSVFVIVTDSSLHVLASSATLGNKTPLPPAGVFDYTRTHGTDHFTWQPEPGVRLATRVLAYGSGASGGFIISGQSLRQAESRIAIYGRLALSAWLASLAWATIILLMGQRRSFKR